MNIFRKNPEIVAHFLSIFLVHFTWFESDTSAADWDKWDTYYSDSFGSSVKCYFGILTGFYLPIVLKIDLVETQNDRPGLTYYLVSNEFILKKNVERKYNLEKHRQELIKLK